MAVRAGAPMLMLVLVRPPTSVYGFVARTHSEVSETSHARISPYGILRLDIFWAFEVLR